MGALNPRQWSEVERLFAAALGLPRNRRPDFLPWEPFGTSSGPRACQTITCFIVQQSKSVRG